MGALPKTGVPLDVTTLDFAQAGGAAIAHEDGHPSKSDQLITFCPNEDLKLRHMMPLGWVVRITDEETRTWERTGHALVMDMDEGRDRHPWIVLAEYWPDDPIEDEERFIHADQEVDDENPDTPGILPGNTYRTPLARLQHYGESKTMNKNVPVLLSLGPEYEFHAERTGGQRAKGKGKGKEQDQPLAKIMDWYDDKERDELVCYDRRGKEYMRYNKKSKRYRYPPIVSPIPSDRFVGLDQRFTPGYTSEPRELRRRRETTTSTTG